MTAIRGATTVSEDCPEQIKSAVKELLTKIKQKNNFKDSSVVCIMLSSTADIHSYYPAKAAREAGFDGCALFSSLEPPIEGALPLCIRVMIICNEDFVPEYVYLNGAAGLRKDRTQKLVIAIDGPAGSGKSTIAKALAKHFNILYLDTGAMYRACALKCLKSGVSVEDESAVGQLVDSIDLKIEYNCGSQITVLDGTDVSQEIRQPEISALASKVSALQCVRIKMVEMQRQIAASMSCVLDGRDIGTNVLPDAQFKFFVTASVDARAKRRYLEEQAKGYQNTYQSVKEDIIVRDKRDTERQFAPLKKADDAIFLDTSDITAEESVNIIISKIQEKI